MTPDQTSTFLGMAPDQIYSLLDSAIKIGLGAIIAGVAAWFSAQNALKKLKLEQGFKQESEDKKEKFERDKIKYERVKDLIYKVAELSEAMEQALSKIAKKKIDVLGYKNSKLQDIYCEKFEEYLLLSDEFDSYSNQASSLEALIGDGECNVAFLKYKLSCNQFYRGINNSTTNDEIKQLNHEDKLIAKNSLQSRLSDLLLKIL